jgi:hypothetical protein
MEESHGDTMDGKTQITGAAEVPSWHNTQRLRLRYAITAAVEQTEVLRARVDTATIESVADGRSNLRLTETGHTLAAA